MADNQQALETVLLGLKNVRIVLFHLVPHRTPVGTLPRYLRILLPGYQALSMRAKHGVEPGWWLQRNATILPSYSECVRGARVAMTPRGLHRERPECERRRNKTLELSRMQRCYFRLTSRLRNLCIVVLEAYLQIILQPYRTHDPVCVH